MTIHCPKCNNSFPEGTKYCPNDGFDLHSNREDHMTGKLFDKRYQIHQKIGQGGMGAVYKATQVATGKTVAIKVISKALSENSETISRFKREVRLQSMLEHPNIINVIDFVETTTNDYYFVMNYIEGKSLKQIILNNGKLPLNFFYQLAFQILNAIDYAHSNNIVHRDLKSDNIIISRLNNEYVVKILDFGIAKALHEADNQTAATELTRTGMVIGTPSYMAPEQAKGEISKVGPRSDIYSMGIIFYQMLSGDLPFHSDTPWGLLHKHIYEQPIPLRKVNPKIPKALEQIIMKCLEKEPENRFPSVAELKKQIMKLAPPVEELNQMIPLIESRTGDETQCAKAVSPFNAKKIFLISVFFLICLTLIAYGTRLFSVYEKMKAGKKESAAIQEKSTPQLNASVKISSDPEGASIEINGVVKQSPAFFEHLKADKYFVSLRLKGYDTKQIEVALVENQCVEKKILLKRQQGEFQLESFPEGAEVWMNGQKMGETPITLGPVDIGIKDITLKKDGFEENTFSVEVIPDERIKYKRIELLPSMGKLFIAAEVRFDSPYIRVPEKGRIRINDEAFRETVLPLELDLRAGKYKAEIEAPGFEKKIFDEIVIPANKICNLKYELIPLKASLLVKSEKKLEVFENDRMIGKSNERILDLIPGKHDMIFKAQGFKPVKNSVILNPGEFVELTTPEITRLVGDIYVKYVFSGKEIKGLEIPDAVLKIGEKNYEKVRLPFLIKELPAGKYPAVLSLEGFKVKALDEIVVSEGGISEIVFELEPLKSDLLISSPEEFDIWENGIRIGTSNTIIKGILPGTRDFIFKSKNSKDRQKKIVLSPGKMTQLKEAPLLKLKGGLRISCEVKGFPEYRLDKRLKVKIRDNDWKNIPMSWIENDLDAGKCTLQVQADGFRNVEPVSLMIESEKIKSVSFMLEPLECEVVIKSNVPGALIFEGRVQLSKSGEPFLLFPFREHALILKAQGYKDREIKVFLEEPGTKNEKFETILEKFPAPKIEKTAEVMPASDKKEIKKGEIPKSPVKIRILSQPNREYANGKNVKVVWKTESREKYIYKYKILLNNKTFKTIFESNTLFKGLKEGKYLVTIIAINAEGGDELAREDYSFTVLKKMKFYHSI